MKKIMAIVVAMCFILSSMCPMGDVQAAAVRSFQKGTDIDYTGGEGERVILKHKESETGTIASYEVNDTRLTRNATFYMSMKVKFDNSHSWAIRLRNVTCKIGEETVTGDMVFRAFDKSGTLQVDGKSVDNWPTYSNIEDNKWHEIIVRSTVNSFEIWVDNVRGKGLYYRSDVTSMTTNYTCPSVSMSGYNSGTIKDICVWNNGKSENPVMPSDKVAQSIESLPDAVAVKSTNWSKIQKAEKAYQALSKEEKKYVVNYDKLEQLLVAVNSKSDAYTIVVDGNKTGAFSEVFPKGIISHKKDEAAVKYYFETETGRKSTYYMQFVLQMPEESQSFDVYLRNQEHTVEGETVSGVVGLRVFKKSATLVDGKQNRISEWANFDTNIFEGSHVITVKSTPTSCTLWIDETKYEIPDYMKVVSGDTDYIAATPGFYMSKVVEGTISDIRVWGENSYVIGDAARVAIYRLPQLNEVTEKDIDAIKEARKMYEELDADAKHYVTNLEHLERLERAVAFIEEKGEAAYAFLKDEIPEVKEDYVNLISTGNVNIPSAYLSEISYNEQTHDLIYTDSHDYVNTKFENLDGVGADDTWLIKFTYVPHEYYYETESASWMGIHITFAGYEVGGNGQKVLNRSKFAFFVNQCGLIQNVNGSSIPTEYLTTFSPQVEQEYEVSMLCEQGKMKVWVNGEPIAYYDELPLYPIALAFESSRCRCDIKDIQLYNMSTPTAPELTEKLAKNVKFIEDLLYDVEGSTDTRQMKEKQMILILSVILFVIVILGSVATCFVCLHKKTGKKGAVKCDEE